MSTKKLALCAILAASALWATPVINAQTKPPDAAVENGRALALFACTGCHVVTADQPFKPIYSGTPHPPDFKEIANRPNMTAAALEQRLEALPAVANNSHMPNQVLSSQELRDVVAFIVSLRDNPASAKK
jgi:mono/diheme cytochrome c family protein